MQEVALDADVGRYRCVGGQPSDAMTLRSAIMSIVQQDDVNFLLTNRIPRRLLTRFMGWFSRIEQPLVRDLSLCTWQFFSGLELGEAKHTSFRSVHDCFIRELKAGTRPVEMDPDVLASPCDAIVGAWGTVEDGKVLQVKGFRYALDDLLGDAGHAAEFSDGCYVTLRLTSGMYHRFHSPHDCRVSAVSHFPGDTWNVNPVTLRRVERLFCKNERAVIRTRLSRTGHALTLVPVAAILVAGIRLRFMDLTRGGRRHLRRTFPCDVLLQKGEEMGWFEHGSTIILFVPPGFQLCDGVKEGITIRAGQGLLRLMA
jgi:phosphatidylserine decarboxylase